MNVVLKWNFLEFNLIKIKLNTFLVLLTLLGKNKINWKVATNLVTQLKSTSTDYNSMINRIE